MSEMLRDERGEKSAMRSTPLWQQVLMPVSRLLCLAMLLALLSPLLMGCGSPAPRPVRVVKQVPPPVLMLDCQRPEADLSTNAAVLDSLLACHAQIVECNRNPAALREWATGWAKLEGSGEAGN